MSAESVLARELLPTDDAKVIFQPSVGSQMTIDVVFVANSSLAQSARVTAVLVHVLCDYFRVHVREQGSQSCEERKTHLVIYVVQCTSLCQLIYAAKEQ